MTQYAVPDRVTNDTQQSRSVGENGANQSLIWVLFEKDTATSCSQANPDGDASINTQVLVMGCTFLISFYYF